MSRCPVALWALPRRFPTSLIFARRFCPCSRPFFCPPATKSFTLCSFHACSDVNVPPRPSLHSVSGDCSSVASDYWLFSQDGLRVQDRNVVLETLTPLTPSVISRQATINIGTIGHVAHGKSTTVKAVSGVYVSLSTRLFPRIFVPRFMFILLFHQTIKYKAEKVRNITIKLGYANAKIYKSSEA